MKIATLIGSMLCFALLFPGPQHARPAEGGLAERMLAETNLARTQPRKYASFLRELRGRFRGKMYLQPGSSALVRTREGVAAVDEAIRFLSRQPPLPPLSWSPGLAEAAAELVRDEGESGATGHAGSRSGGMQERIERHGRWEGEIGEVIGYGPTTARLMVMELIVDDGVPGRGHRKDIFTPAFRVAGAACGPHPVFGTMCVMDFAAGFR